MGSGKGGDGKVTVRHYFMSIHMGLCAAGEGLRLRQVWVGEKTLWRGDETLPVAIDRDRLGLFGGKKKEGGAAGFMHWLPGAANQVIPNALAKRFNRTAATCPGFRGVASIFFVGRRSVGTSPSTPDEWTPPPAGGFGSGQTGFYWGSNNPYLRPVWAKVTRPPIGLNPNIAMVAIDDEDDPEGANPAHVIYESLHNRTWGGAVNPAATDRLAFETAAQTLYNEGFAVCAKWTRQSTIEDFVNEILDHINGTLFLHPQTGKLTLKLLRADYDVAELRQVTPTNAVIENLSRKAWGETGNEIVVTYTDPRTEKPATVSAQDLAGIASQGGISSSSRDYHAVRSAKLATSLAERELAASVQPISTCEIVMSRTAWDVIPGEVMLLAGWAELGIGQMVVRVGKVVADGPTSNSIRITAYEDIFGSHISNYVGVADTEWEDPQAEPQPISEMILHAAPGFLMAAKLGVEDPATLDTAEGMLMLLPRRETEDDAFYELLGPVTLPNGQTEMRSLGDKDFAATATLPDGLPAEAESFVPTLENVLGGTPQNGQFVVIGPAGSETDEAEIALVASVSTDGWSLYRGVLDTVPMEWPAGTVLWCIPDTSGIPDNTVRARPETITYKLLPTTSLGALDEADAPEVSAMTNLRPHRPLRPADVRVAGVAFGTVDATNASDLPITWARRNRSQESTQALSWTDGDVSPEAGQTTYIRLLEDDGVTQITELEADNPTSHDLDLSEFGVRESGWIQVVAKNGAVYSLTGAKFRVLNIGASADFRLLAGDAAEVSSDARLLAGDAQSTGIDKREIN